MSGKRKILFGFTNRERTAVLAALRVAQMGTNKDQFDSLEHWDHVGGGPLSNDEIDDLCEEINCPYEGYTQPGNDEYPEVYR
jgi:hypothetical protein